MRRIALINQKGGVGKTTTAANLGAALALAGKRVAVVDLDPQANLTLYLGVELAPGAPSSYRVLTGEIAFAAALRNTSTPNLRLLPTDIHLSGAELELSATHDREKLMRAALDAWVAEHKKAHRGEEPADYVLFDCPPSLGLLSLNALAAADEVFLVVQTQFLALQGMSKLVEVIELVKQRLHPGLKLSGIVPCMYDSRMRLAREVLAELRRYFPAQVFRTPISANVKLAESPSFAKTIFEYAPDSLGARDFASLSHEVLTQEVLARPAAEPEPARKKHDLGEALRGASAGAMRTLPAASAPTPPREAPKPAPAPAAKKAEKSAPVQSTPDVPPAPVAAAPKATPAAPPRKLEPPKPARAGGTAPAAPATAAKKIEGAAPEPVRAPPPARKAPAATAAPAKREPTRLEPVAARPPESAPTPAPAKPAAPAPRKSATAATPAPAPRPAKLEPVRELAPAPSPAPTAESGPPTGARRPRSKPAVSG